MAEVLFLRGLAADYHAKQDIKSDVFYYLTDTSDIYFGTHKLNNSADLVAALSRVSANEQNISSIIDRLTVIEGDASVPGSVRNLIADALTSVNTILDQKIGTIPKKTISNPDFDPDDPDSPETIEVDQTVMEILDAVSNSIDTLNGDSTTAGSVEKKVRDAIAEVIASAPEDFDTLKEISDWIATHGSDAAQMNTQIQANTQAIADQESFIGQLPAGVSATTVIDYIAEAVENGKYDPTDITKASKCLVVPEAAYQRSQIASADFPIAVAVKDNAFNECFQLTSVNLPLVRTVGEMAFANCITLAEVNLPLATYVGKDSFAMDMSVATLNAPLLRVVGNGAFQNTNIKKIDLPSCEIIEDVGFGGSFECEEINIPLVYKIGQAAFQNARKVESLTLNNVREIGALAFYDCQMLKEVTINTTWVPTADHDMFRETPMDTADSETGKYGTIYVRGELIDQFKNASGWSTYADRFAVIPGTEVRNCLPEVSSSDAGKILKVNNAGEWDKGDVEGASFIYWGNF